MRARGPERAALLWVLFAAVVSAQQRGGPPQPPKSPKDAAPVDLTGYWVSLVTEDWRWRMVTPLKGDSASVPVNPAAKKVMNDWDPAKDEAAGNQCRAYGAAAIMRLPGRLHITWQDENTLKIEFDAGTQTQLVHFGPAPAASGPKTWQGVSTGAWERPGRNAVADARVAESVQSGTVPGGGGAGLRGAPPRSAAMFEGGSLAV